MTADEIKALTDEQARDAVARTLGLELHMSSGDGMLWRWWIDAKTGKRIHDDDWNPCANIADAWPLFEQLLKQHMTDTCWEFYHSTSDGGVWVLVPWQTGEPRIVHPCVCRAIANAYLWASENGMLRKDGER